MKFLNLVAHDGTLLSCALKLLLSPNLQFIWHNFDKCEPIAVVLYSCTVPSVVCLLSVTLVHHCTLLRRLKFSAMFLRHLVRWTSVDFEVKFYGDRPRGTPHLGVLNRRGEAKYRDFGPLQDNISETVQDRR